MIPRRYLIMFDGVAIGCALVALVCRAFKWYPYDVPPETEWLADAA